MLFIMKKKLVLIFLSAMIFKHSFPTRIYTCFIILEKASVSNEKKQTKYINITHSSTIGRSESKHRYTDHHRIYSAAEQCPETFAKTNSNTNQMHPGVLYPCPPFHSNLGHSFKMFANFSEHINLI